MTGTRLESPIRRCDERTNVEVNEQALVPPYADIPQSPFYRPNTFLKSVEVAGSQGLGMAEDVYCPLDQAGLQPLFGGNVSTRGREIGKGLTHGRANQRDQRKVYQRDALVTHIL